jgi:membrane protease YdiL (CAAX protease family)
MIKEQIEAILLFALLSFIALWIAKGRGFFTLPPYKKPEDSLKLPLGVVLAAFVIYLSYSLLLAPLFIQTVGKVSPFDSPMKLGAWTQFFTTVLIGFSLFFLCRFQNPTVMKKIWKERLAHSHAILSDIVIGSVTWLMSYPVVSAVGQTSDLFLYLLFGIEGYEQVAVRYLKMTLGVPVVFSIALFTIVIAAPFLEEFLFRGLLQTWIKQRMGQKAAILLSSCCFALFHLSPAQGWGNVTVALSLFVFALFLGFVYERQQSLFASISLHMTFNVINVVRIIYAPS